MKRIYAIFFPLICLMVFAGCSGNTPQAIEPDPTAEPTSTAAEVAQVEATATPRPSQTAVPTKTLTPVVIPLADEEATNPYPEPTEEPKATGYPEPTAQLPTPTEPTREPYPAASGTVVSYLPAISNPAFTPTPNPTETPTPTFTPSPTHTPTPIPTLDFGTLRQEYNSRGVELVHGKIGFHTGPGGNRNGFGEYMRRLDEVGVPFFLKSVSDSAALLEAQNLMKESGVPHTLVYRWAETGYDVPDYTLSPAAAAQKHWDIHMEKWPPELDKEVVWLETINEVDKERSEWLAEFSLETAKLAQRDGFKWASFGWSSGEPEISHWEGPKMQEFLRLVANNPDTLAIALHEYSYRQFSIEADAPYLVGRFQSLYQVTDSMRLPRPTVLITEWGWTYENVPDVDTALEHIDWANKLYAPYPEVKGAAIWYLGPGYDDISDQAQRLIYPVMVQALTTAYERPLN